MKSGRQRRDELKARRRTRAAIARRMVWDPLQAPWRLPRHALPADPGKLLHDNTYGPRPRFYEDQPFTCIDCGKDEIWTADQQKWWYEEAKGKIASRANRCRECRRARRLRRAQERRAHIEGMVAKHGLERAADALCMSRDALSHLLERWEAG